MRQNSQKGVINGGIIAMLIGGLAVGGLLVYGALTGQELPFWPSVVVILVNIVAAVRVFMAARKAKQLRESETPPQK